MTGGKTENQASSGEEAGRAVRCPPLVGRLGAFGKLTAHAARMGLCALPLLLPLAAMAQVEPKTNITGGLAAMEMVATRPLYTIISFKGTTTDKTGARYYIGVEQHVPGEQVKDRLIKVPIAFLEPAITVGTKTKYFTLVRVDGDPVNPDALILNVEGVDGQVGISPSKPFIRIDGYLADLKYAPEMKRWVKQRVGDKLVIAGEKYNIDAISENEVVLSTQSGEKTTVRRVPHSHEDGTRMPAEGGYGQTNTPTVR